MSKVLVYVFCSKRVDFRAILRNTLETPLVTPLSPQLNLRRTYFLLPFGPLGRCRGRTTTWSTADTGGDQAHASSCVYLGRRLCLLPGRCADTLKNLSWHHTDLFAAVERLSAVALLSGTHMQWSEERRSGSRW
jgi:hypothetical protein